jgi:starch synthase
VREGFAVWHVTREYAGLAEAGGVKDVARGLAEAQARAGCRATVMLPLYGFMPGALKSGDLVAAFTLALPDQDQGNAMIPEDVRVHAAELGGVRMLLVESPRFSSARDVYTHTQRDEEENHWKTRGSGHWDAHQKNITLQRAAIEAALALGERPDVFHCHDGHTAFLPALLREEPRLVEPFGQTRAVVTIHNAGAGYHQEVWNADFARLLTGLPPAVIKRAMLGTSVDPLLLAGDYARVVTVSEQYARELMAEREKEMSGGLGRAFRERGISLAGITNGIDPRPWDPRAPGSPGLPFPFDPLTGDLEGKRKSREVLVRTLGLPADPGGPLYAYVGRLAGQKGIDVLFHALKDLLRSPEQRLFAIVGRGEKDMESMLAWLAAEPSTAGRLAFVPRYDQDLASLLYAASDFFLIPSAYEPCGLTDFIAQIRGSIPVVHRVGGLVKVRDGETGFSYDEHSPAALAASVQRTTRLVREDPALLERVRRVAFQEIFSRHTWDRVYAESYLPLYESAVPAKTWTGR